KLKKESFDETTAKLIPDLNPQERQRILTLLDAVLYYRNMWFPLLATRYRLHRKALFPIIQKWAIPLRWNDLELAQQVLQYQEKSKSLHQALLKLNIFKIPKEWTTEGTSDLIKYVKHIQEWQSL